MCQYALVASVLIIDYHRLLNRSHIALAKWYIVTRTFNNNFSCFTRKKPNEVINAILHECSCSHASWNVGIGLRTFF
jgi:hypothetical protein